jgi:GAF domain-containing protein
MSLHLWDYAPDALEVRISELLIATATRSDTLIDDTVRDVLHELRSHLDMDVIFLSEIRDGQRMFKHVDSKPGCELIATGGGASLEESFCQCVLDGRLPQLVHDAATHPAFSQLPATPFRVGAHLSTPIVLADGRVYGTLCCFSQAADPTLTERDLMKLGSVARVAAKRIDARLQSVRDAEMAAWQIEPADSPRRR